MKLAYNSRREPTYANISTPMPDYLLPRDTRRVMAWRKEKGSNQMIPVYADE